MYRVTKALSRAGLPFRSLAMTGGTEDHDRRAKSFKTQKVALEAGVDVVICTPGRLLSHLEKGILKLDATKAIVLDEVDCLCGEWLARQCPLLLVLNSDWLLTASSRLCQLESVTLVFHVGWYPAHSPVGSCTDVTHCMCILLPVASCRTAIYCSHGKPDIWTQQDVHCCHASVSPTLCTISFASLCDITTMSTGAEVNYTQDIKPVQDVAPPGLRFVLVSATLPQHICDQLQQLFPGLQAMFGPGLHRPAAGEHHRGWRHCKGRQLLNITHAQCIALRVRVMQDRHCYLFTVRSIIMLHDSENAVLSAYCFSGFAHGNCPFCC